jgi:aminoglycoside phosphotransferase (APT) family kinase protein
MSVIPGWSSGNPDLDDLLQAVEMVFGARVLEGQMLGSSGRSLVAVLSVSGPKNWTERIVLKRVQAPQVVNQPSGAVGPVRFAPDVAEAEANQRFEVELAAYERLDAAGCRAVPRLLGSLRDERVLVLEHLAGEDLVPMLLSSTRKPAADALVALAVALGKIHSAGMTKASRPSPQQLATAVEAKLPAVRAGAARLAQVAGITTRAWEEELESLAARLALVGPFTTWTHGDPCPGNIVLADGQARLVDLELVAPAHALLEAVYLRMACPTCWCVGRIDSELLNAAETAYRQELQRACPDIKDDAKWWLGLADACCWWALDGSGLVQRAERGPLDLIDRALSRDWLWGRATARQRLTFRVDQAASVMADVDNLMALTELLTLAGESLLAGCEPLSEYPALAT